MLAGYREGSLAACLLVCMLAGMRDEQISGGLLMVLVGCCTAGLSLLGSDGFGLQPHNGQSVYRQVGSCMPSQSWIWIGVPELGQEAYGGSTAQHSSLTFPAPQVSQQYHHAVGNVIREPPNQSSKLSCSM